MYYKNHE